MKQTVIVTGHLAALKTTVSKRLAADLNAVCLNKDDLKEVLGDTIGFANREENLKLSAATFSLMRKLMPDILKADDLVVLESNFRRAEYEAVRRDAADAGIRVLTIFMTGDPDVLYARYLARQESRHSVHKSTGTIPPEMFTAILTPFDSALYGEDAVLVDATYFTETDYRDLLDLVRHRLEGGIR